MPVKRVKTGTVHNGIGITHIKGDEWMDGGGLWRVVPKGTGAEALIAYGPFLNSVCPRAKDLGFCLCVMGNLLVHRAPAEHRVLGNLSLTAPRPPHDPHQGFGQKTRHCSTVCRDGHIGHGGGGGGTTLRNVTP